MDRQIVYPGAIPLDTDVLNLSVNAMIALGFLAQATLGTSQVVDGMAISASTAPDMQVHVAPGSIVQLSTVDASTFGSLAANTAPLVKMGINTLETAITLTAPGTAGHTINYLIQATMTEADAVPVVLPYYNASNPAVPYSGPAGAGTPQNTKRTQRVSITAKAGTSATTGTQTTPAPDAGYVGLYVVAVANAQTTITNTNLTTAPSGRLPAAPFVPFKLAELRPGFSAIQRLSGSGNFTVPNSVTKIRVRAVGGGAGGGGGNGTGAGGGGGGGGYSEDIQTVTPGQVIAYVVGAAGAGGANTGANGTSGGNTTFNGITAGGGVFGAGGAGTAGNSGGGGTSSGGTLNSSGQAGNAGYVSGTTLIGGFGGSSALGGGGASSSGTPSAGSAYGGAGAGGASTQAGAAGAAGTIIVEW